MLVLQYKDSITFTTSIPCYKFGQKFVLLIILIDTNEYSLYNINIKINLSCNDVFFINIYKSNT